MEEPAEYIKAALANIHDEVMAKYYGCGLAIPSKLEGLRILDLGSGSGRDCFILSQLVGQNGEVIGVDMTDEQLEVANRHIDYHTKQFGYNRSNVRFKEVEEKCGDIKFFSVTYRLWKIDGLEDECEDYGQAVAYKGTIENNISSFDLDDHHNFPKNKIMTVCGNTYKMLHDTRLAEHFEFYGSWDTHYGIFEGCGGAMPFNTEDGEAAGCC